MRIILAILYLSLSASTLDLAAQSHLSKNASKYLFSKQTTSEHSLHRLPVAAQSLNKNGVRSGSKVQLDSLIGKMREAQTGLLENMVKENFKYDRDGNLITSKTYFWSSQLNEWDLSYHTSYEFANGNLIRSTFDAIDNGRVNESERWSYYYDTGNRLMGKLLEEWDINSSQWIPVVKSEYQENQTTNTITETEFDWDESNQVWTNLYQRIRQYSSSGELINLQVSYFDDNSLSFAKVRQISYQYDADYHLESAIESRWDSDLSAWIQSENSIFEYNTQGNLIKYTEVEWSESTQSWSNFQYKSDYLYNNDGYINGVMWSDWDDDIQNWILYDSTVLGIDPSFEVDDLILPITIEEIEDVVSELQIETIFSVKIDKASTYSNGDILVVMDTDYFWSEQMISSVVDKAQKIEVFPNPSQGSLHLPDQINHGAIHILNSSGIEVLQLQLNASSVDVSSLPNGHYVLIIENDFETYRGQFVKT